MSPSAVTPGEIPAAYRPAAAEPLGERGPVREPAEEKSGRKRRLDYPPAPEPLPVPVIDNHAHLDFRDGQVQVTVAEHLDAAQQVGVSGAVLVGYDVASSRFSVEAARTDPRAKAAVALHPNDAPQLAEKGKYASAFEEITTLAEAEHVVAVGETGLDFFRTAEAGRAAQKESFYDHLALAAQRGLPVQIHDREAHADVVRVLKDAPALPPAVVFHCYSGDAELARICNANGWYMSFAGTVTFNNAEGIRDGLREADPQLILVETDCPFLTPHPYRGQPNAPYMIPQTMRRMAQVREAALPGLCQQVMLNTAQAYGTWT
ncbi:TatD family hydrolase [Nesterenkonia sp. NBAIMH1]|uniref:TatD family hydrolase n=1 Tax=Nesterenkonia sp. NBAIMH1 TaxID=2600320 RepID=UPI001FED955A|nr:TatD family hydrolase [Nesterenkonia sp. NBAIMH1]